MAKTSATPLSDQLKASGNWNPNWTPFEELDPVWTEKFMTMAFHPLDKNLLDAKTVEFISIAVDASCTHMYGPGVRRHIKKALELGASKEEILAVLQLTSVLGVHSLSLGAPMLQEEFAAFSKDQKSAQKSHPKSTKNAVKK
jgi:alkylhydroperoxidase/carboxymuconolactone decarboxylase family protein YurZ